MLSSTSTSITSASFDAKSFASSYYSSESQDPSPPPPPPPLLSDDGDDGKPRRRRRFRPLDPKRGGEMGEEGGEWERVPVLKGVIFDVDGTLCLPQNYMFREMRTALNITPKTDILDHIYSLPTPLAQEEAMEKIRTIERTAMAKQQPQAGLVEVMDFLKGRGVRLGICTRNFDTPVHHLLQTFLPTHTFSPIITRDFRPPKPHPAGILHIANSWDLDARNCIMVGDSIDDMTAGRLAGATTVLLAGEHNLELQRRGQGQGHEFVDLVVGRLDQLVGVLEGGL